MSDIADELIKGRDRITEKRLGSYIRYSEYKKLKSKLDKAVKTLEFYTSLNHYTAQWGWTRKMYLDQGKKARQALREIKDDNNSEINT